MRQRLFTERYFIHVRQSTRELLQLLAGEGIVHRSCVVDAVPSLFDTEQEVTSVYSYFPRVDTLSLLCVK